MKYILLLFIIAFFSCTEDSVINNIASITSQNDQKIASNSISKVEIIGDSLYIYTDYGYSISPSLSQPELLYHFDNDVYTTYPTITYAYFNGDVYCSYRSTTRSTNIKKFSNGMLQEEYTTPWTYYRGDFILEMLQQGDSLYAARYNGLLSIVINGKYYLSPIDTIKGNLIEFPSVTLESITDTNNTFNDKYFKKHFMSHPENNVNGVKFFENIILAQTYDGIYASTDGDVWTKISAMHNIAKECVESSVGVVNGNPVFYGFYNNLSNASFDTLYLGNRDNNGLYYSSDNLQTFQYDATFRNKVFKNMKAHKNRILISTTDSIFFGTNSGTSISWNAIAVSSTLANNVISVDFNDSIIVMGTDNVGVMYSKDFKNWKYITKSNAVAFDLAEYYAYPNKITTADPAAKFVYNLSKDDYVTISMYDSNKDLVKTIINNQLRTAGTITINSSNILEDLWDGKGANGKSVNPGLYHYNITTKNSKLSVWGNIVVGVLQ